MRRYRQPILVGILLLVFVVGGYIYSTHPTGNNVKTKRIDVTVTAGETMSPRTWTANQNDSIVINITSDMDGEVHLHGYDIKFQVSKGLPYTKTFVADITGDFPIEWEETSTPLGDLKVSP